MIYKGRTIVANARVSIFFDTNEDGEALERRNDVKYFDAGDDELWYSVLDDDNWVGQSFETVQEAKEAIDEEEV